MQDIISIIIPTYNRSHLIGETLDSILNQSYKNWECIVVDDGSDDFTVELMEFYLSKDKRIQYYQRPKNFPKGANACRNYGFTFSNGSYIKWFDSDDKLNHHYLEEKILLLTSSNPDLVICDTVYYNNDTNVPNITFKNTSDEKDLLIDYLTGRININTQAVLYKREFVQNFDFDEKLCRAQELDFNFRLLKERKFTVAFVEKVLVLIRGHSESLTGEYYAGKLSSIRADLSVRRRILEFVLKNDFDQKIRTLVLNLYLPGLRSLYKHHPLKEFYTELESIEPEKKLKNKFLKWKVILLILILQYKITGRQYRLEKHLFSLKI